MARRSSTPFDDFGAPPDAGDLVIKVKYGDTLKRFNAYVNGPHFDQNLAALRCKIISAFKFSPDANFILTYTDEDGDVVMLDDDDDLRDAAIHQKLNPIRINVQLKSSNGGENKQQTSNSTPSRSTPLEDPLAQVKSTIDEALRSLPEPVPSTLGKLSHDLLSKAASSAPPFTELLDHFAKLMTPNSNSQPSDGPMGGSSAPPFTELLDHFAKLMTPNSNSQPSNGPMGGPSVSSSGVQQPPVDHKANDEPKAPTNSAPRPSDVQNSESSNPTARGLKSVLVEAPVAPSVEAPRDQQASGYPSIEELLFSTCSGGNKVDREGNSDAQHKGSSAAPPVCPVVPPVPPAPPALFMGDWLRRYEPPFEATGKFTSDSKRHFPMFGMPPVPPTYAYTPFKCKSNVPSPHIPYPARLLSSGHPYRDLDDNHESLLPHTFHRWIQCDGCGMQPIVGPRYKSNVKEDYDLCSTCFSRMGNEAEYARIDKPILPRRMNVLRDPNMCRRIHSRGPMKSKREKLESRFILDVTVLDGTMMSPSTPFTKIWRMRNNGSTLWPFGTQLIWVGGDQFALQSSVQLEIPVNGFPVDQEIDIAVDFAAPARPGRYISYWRLASPSGQKFGQRVWVLIQVEQPSYTNGNNQSAINLNLPPESNSRNGKQLIDVNVEPVDVFGEFIESTQAELLKPLIYEEVKPKESEPAPSVVLPVPAVVPPVLDAIVDLPSSSSAATPAAFVPVNVPAPEPVNVPVNVPAPEPVNVPVNVPAPEPVNVPVNVPAPEPVNVPVNVPWPAPGPVNDGLMEETLLRELEEMGFRQVDLNKEILRQNKYNLEQSVDDLCGFSEWDPLLAELQEMGFDDTDMNKELLMKNGGSIKRAVMDLVAREKKDQ